MIQAGIDEAGYGPILGPLVVSLTAFDVADAAQPVDLWRRLRRAVLRRVGRQDSARIPVADSKELYQTGRLALLEHTALAFCALARDGTPPRTAGELLDQLALGGRPDLEAYPWYRGIESLALPLAADAQRLARSAAALHAEAAAAGVRLAALFVLPLLEGEYSRRVERIDNKATLLFDLNVRLIEAVVPGASALFVRCDRHGGRRQYAPVLASAFPLRGVTTLHEDGERSCYRVGHGARALMLDYLVRGERHGLEVALASVLAKYTRELFIEQMNRHFLGRVKDLRRTAGYHTDGLRFVADLERSGTLEAAERHLLVRSR